MRKVTLTAMALALTVAAGAAQADSPRYLPYYGIQGFGDMRLPKVHVHPHTVKIDADLHLENAVEFGQINDGDMKSLQGFASIGPKKVEGTSAAIGNTANIETTGGVFVEGKQKNFGDMKAVQGALVLGAERVTLTTAAIGNATNIDTDGDAGVNMTQMNMNRSLRSGQLSGVGTYGHELGKVEITSAAIGNTLSVEFGSKSSALVSSRQGNWADATAVNITGVGGKFKSAEITSAAIGNALSVVNK